MKTLAGLVLALLSGSVVLADIAELADDSTASSVVLVRADNKRSKGRLSGDRSNGFVFHAEGSKEPTRLAPGMKLEFAGTAPNPGQALPPFRVEFGLDQRISGRIGSIDDREVALLGMPGGVALAIRRAGVRSVVQRPGETVMLEEGFETLESPRWTHANGAGLDSAEKTAGSRSAMIPAGDASLVHRLRQAVGSGRLEADFRDSGAMAAGQQWSIDLTFRGVAGSTETLRTLLGWSEGSLAVESPGGPALAVQRLERRPGWHRLSVRFGPDGTAVSIDGNELARGKGFSGPMLEIRIASTNEGKVPQGLAGHVDELRLVRFDEPVGGLEVDATQDEVRLTGGDQIFGKFQSANAEQIRIQVDGSDVTLPWTEVSGLHFRRESGQGATIAGLLVRAEWRSAPGNDLRDLNQIEGALSGLSDTSLTVATPYAGSIVIPRDRLKIVTLLGQGTRIVIDATAHHLGDEVSAVPPLLDPPQPEGGVLERTVVLEEVPAGAAFLVLDVMGVVGESPELLFSDLVKANQLRTNLKWNGAPFDYVNHYIFSKNDTPERVRIPIPKDLLRVGKNEIRFELMGTKVNPTWLDDLGVLGIALEFEPAKPH